MPSLVIDPASLIVAGLILCAGSTLQSAAGFGYGMFAVPLLMLADQSSYEAIAVVSVSVVVQAAWSAWLHRADFDWRQVAVMLGLAGITVPLGVLVQGRLAESGPVFIRQVFGGTVLAILVLQIMLRIRPRASIPLPWMFVAFPLSGTMAGLAGMGGPPAVVWVMAHAWPAARSRATLWALFAGLTPIQLGVLSARFGLPEVSAAAGFGLLLLPFTLIGMRPGLWIGAQLSPRALRGLSVAILMAVSVYAIVQPWVMPRG